MRILLLLITLLYVGCSDTDSLTGKISVTNIVNPDEIPPTITFNTTPAAITGNADFTVAYSVVDNLGGSGIRSNALYFSADGVSYSYIKNLPVSGTSVKVCVPNLNLPSPSFKIVATDNNNNSSEKVLGDALSGLFSINVDTEPVLPTISSSNGTVTNEINSKILINACKQTKCANDATILIAPSNNLFVAIGPSQPATGSASWVNCSDVLTNGITTPNYITDNTYTHKIWTKSEDTDFDTTPISHISSGSSDLNVVYDTTSPDLTGIVVEGTNLTGKSLGTYRLSDCTDIDKVLVNKAGAPPLATDAGWQNCSQTVFSIRFTDMISGSNNMKFWVKDAVGNVASSFLSYSTTYDPPAISVVDGPTISTSNANLTIEFCDEVGMTHVFFNETGTQPSTGASGWQTCSTATGAFTYGPLSPGPSTLKAFFKYNDGLISPNPIDVPVYFNPTVSWVQSPITRRPQSTFSLASCEGITSVYIKTPGPAPLNTDSGWQNCSTAIGAISYDGLSEGTQTLNFWFKDALENVYGDYATASVTFTPPSTSVKNAPTISTPKAYLTVDTCSDISNVYVTLDDATTPTGLEGSWVSCSTANNAIQSPNFVTDGSHTIRVWYKFNDGYILPNYNQHVVTYVSPDITPPPLTTGAGAIADITATLENGDGSGPPPTVLSSDSRADFTISSCTPTADTLDNISHVLITTTASIPSANALGWQTCSTVNSAIQSNSLADGTYTLRIWFKDDADNVNSTPLTQDVIIDASGDVTPPPRPLVVVENAPTLTVAPATMTVSTCTDIDQVFVNNNADPQPSAGDTQWQNCSTATGAISYPIDVAGDYTLQVWFKDTAGNINPLPRSVSFIFAPVPSVLPEPVAYWSMDSTHFFSNNAIDTKGNKNLSISSPSTLGLTTGKIKEAMDFDGAIYLVTPNDTTLKPTVGVSLSLWAYLTNGDGSTKHIIGNISSGGGYGLRLESNELRFYTNGINVKVPSTDYTTGWHHIVGTSDGQITKLFIDGVLKDTYDSGSPDNINYGCAKIFAIGASVSTCTDNVEVTNKFQGTLDEIALFNVNLTDTQVYNLYVDNQNKFKPNYSTTNPADITTASFFGTFEQTALLTIGNCADGKFIYVNETTHPPTIGSPKWIPCNNVLGGVWEYGLAQGAHELKVWTKDEYENISSGYQKVDTTITSFTSAVKPIIHFNLDNTHNSAGTIRDYFSNQTAVNNGATLGTLAIQNEGYRFNKSEVDYIESKYSSSSMVNRDLSFSVWAKLTKNDNRTQVIAGNRVGSSGYSIEIDGPNAELKFIVETVAGKRELAVTTTSFETDFHNIVGTYNGQVATMYLDGTLVASSDFGSISNINYSCLPSFIIGAGATCNSGAAAGTHFDNIIDEVIVWNSTLTAGEVDNIFNGQDTVPPEPVGVTPKDNNYTVDIPLVKVNIANCDDIASVYVTTSTLTPSSSAANWQACSTSGDKIISDLLNDGTNLVKTWFKDAAGNVSLSSTDMTITFNYDYTIPQPNSYWTLDDVNVTGATAFDVFGGKNGIITNANLISAKVFEGEQFGGVDSNIRVDYDSSLQPTNKVTLSAWIKNSTWPTTDKYIAGNLNDGGYALVLGNNSIEFRVKANSVINTISVSTASYPAGNFYMITGIYDNGLMRLFVNNLEVNNINIGTFPIEYTYTNAFVMGASAGTGNNILGNYYAGIIDEVSFFNDALTDTVVAAMYDRGMDGDKVYYDVTPPEVPVSLNLNFYNALVSRANLSASDCTGIDYIIVTASKFPPDLNDEDWQACNTLTGGILSKGLDPSDSYGKVWTKDVFGNISKTFQYTPITTNYDKAIARPVTHWTFDSSHNNQTTRQLSDRISGNILTSEMGVWQDIDPDPGVTTMRLIYSGTADNLLYNQTGVLNSSVRLQSTSFTRCDNCDNMNIKDEISVSAWVYIPAGHSNNTQYILGNQNGASGYALRFKNDGPIGARLEFFIALDSGEILTPYLETSTMSSSWHLVTGVYDGQTASLYFDGIFVKSFAALAPSKIKYTNGTKFAIGNAATTGTTPFDYSTTVSTISSTYAQGSIDEVLIWKEALTGLMVSSLYHNGADLIYDTDTTPPANPTLRQENQKALMYDDKLYITVNSCSDISGVLVNEGTKPDKQDERWQVCRTRSGSYNRYLTEGGHTVTLWFKDLAGNVTNASSDVVVDYTSLTLPVANAYWPLDENTYIDRTQRDTISLTHEHDLYAYNYQSTENVNAMYGTGKVGESVNLLGNAFLTGDVSKFTRPVNELSLGGWFYLENGDNTQRTLIESAYNDTIASATSGYRIYKNSGILYFKLGLTIAGERIISSNISALPSGWYHILGVFNNNKSSLYVDGSEVATTTLAEDDFIRWDTSPRFNIGANVENSSDRPGTLFNNQVDEIAIWGLALTSSEIISVVNKGNAGQRIFDSGIRRTPANVNNAYVYHVDNFESRAKFTILNCTDTDYIYIGDPSITSPNPNSIEWRACNTTPGSIISAKLPVNTNYVRVWSKNLYGDVSSGFALHEIPPITDDDDLPLPILYYAYEDGQATSSSYLDLILRTSATASPAISNTPVTSNATGKGIRSTSSGYTTTSSGRRHVFDQNTAITILANLELINADASSKGFIEQGNMSLYQSGGRLIFYIARTLNTAYSNYSSASGSVSIPLSEVSTGIHQVAAQYDGQILKLYLDGVLRHQLDIAEDNFQTQTRQRLPNGPSDIIIGRAAGAYNATFIDEVMFFDESLTETEIISYYDRLKKKLITGDITAPATVPTVAVDLGTWNGSKWDASNPEVYLTLDNCTDIAGVYVSTNSATAPLEDVSGWQYCSTSNGSIKVPTLSAGDNTIRIWFKDTAGNVTSVSIDTTITYNAPPVDPVPLAYWSFDADSIFSEKAYESVGLKHAELNYYISTAGKSNEGLLINPNIGGTNRAHAKVEYDTVYKPENEISISLWTNISNDCAQVKGTLLSTMNGSTDGYKLTFENNYPSTSLCYDEYKFLHFYFSREGVLTRSTIPKIFLGAGYNHIVITYDGRIVKWYLNNILRHTDDFLTKKQISYVPANKTPLYFGVDVNIATNGPLAGANSFFDGSLDEVAIYNTALLPNQVNTIYGHGMAQEKLYNPTRPNTAPNNTKAAIFDYNATQPFYYGDRIRVTMNDCTDADLVLINDSLAAPATNDENWQPCNLLNGAILSSPLTTGSATTPRLWIKGFDGVINATSATLNDLTVNIPTTVTISRPKTVFTLDNVASKHTTATNFFDAQTHNNQAIVGTIPTGFEPISLDSPSTVMYSGFDFNGVDDYLAFPPSAANTFEQDISISAWVYLTKGDSKNSTIISNIQNGASNTGGIALRLLNNNLEFVVSTNMSNSLSSAPATYKVAFNNFSYNTGFHHIIGTFDGKELKLYLDGVFIDSYAISFYVAGRYYAYNNYVTPWYIGAEAGENGPEANSYFKGIIDDINIFSSVLTDAQIIALYNYGAQFKISNLADGTPPNDPNVFIKDNLTSVTSPFAYFTSPSCTAPNGQTINSIFIRVDDATAPTNFESGWQYCTKESNKLISDLLTEGTSTIYIYFRDEEGDISTATTLTVEYIPPTLTGPKAYYKFENNLNDSASSLHLRSTSPRFGTGKVGSAYGIYYSSGTNTVIDRTYLDDLSFVKNFSISLWYKPDDGNGDILNIPNQLSITKGTDEKISVFVKSSWWGGNTAKTEKRVTPNQWNHVGVTRLNNTVKVFLNGMLSATFTVNDQNLPDQNANFIIGYTNTSSTAYAFYDEYAFYNEALSDDQLQYTYYLGYKGLSLPVENKNIVPAPIPEHFYSFDSSDLVGSTLSDIGKSATNPITTENAVTTGSATSILNESFYFTRFETTDNGTANDKEVIIGPQQSVIGSSGVSLGSDFTLSTWVKLNKTNTISGNIERHTILSQWGNTNADRSFILWLDRNNNNGTVNFSYNTQNQSAAVSTGIDKIYASDTLWHHIVVRKKQGHMAIFFDGYQSGYINNASTLALRIPTLNLKFGNSDDTTSDEWAYQGNIDETAIWNSTALSQAQIRDLFTRGSTKRASLNPELVLATPGSIVETTTAQLTINDCSSSDYIWVANASDAVPSASDTPSAGQPGWQTCSTVAGAISTLDLVDGLNNLTIYFKKSGVVSSYTYNLNVTKSTTDLTPPALPTMSLTSATTTTSAIATFTSSTCVDIAGIYISKTSAGAPSKDASGWISCSTIASAIKYPKLEEGLNNISIWFKDAAGNVTTTSRDFSITLNSPTIAAPTLYLPMDKEYSGAAGAFDIIAPIFFSGNNTNKISSFDESVVGSALDFLSTGYLERDSGSISLTNQVSFSSWVNLSKPSTRATLFSKWDEVEANNQISIEVDTEGRLCFAFQTTASAGATSWNTDAYSRICSYKRINFGEWSHIAITRNAQNLNFYINGDNEKAEDINVADFLSGTAPTSRIGAQFRNGDHYLAGSIDEFAIWTSELTKDEVEYIYAKGNNANAISQYIQPQTPAVPSMYWTFDNVDYTDSPVFVLADKMANMDFVNTNAIDGVSGIRNEAFSFLNAEKLTGTSTLDLGAQFTISTWVYLESDSDDDGMILNKWSTSNEEFKLYTSAGIVKFDLKTTEGSTTYSIISPVAIDYDKWTNIIISRDGTEMKLFINGALDAINRALPANPTNNLTAPLLVGSYGTTNYFTGLIDETVIYKKVLDRSQINAIYKAGKQANQLPITQKVSAAHPSNTVYSASVDLTIGDCLSFSHILVQPVGTGTPVDATPGWVSCSEAIGAISFGSLNLGNNDLEIWFKNGSTVEGSATDTISINRAL